MKAAAFKKTIWKYYKEHRRDFPWRHTTDPYKIFISEVMLQQTQAPRVVEKYHSFLKQFPNFTALAKAPLGKVLKEWKGLGYNRRALNLKRAAEIIVEKHKSRLPGTVEELDALPGIGPHTAGSIIAFACNKPTVFIETNIRTVFIHFFFSGHGQIHDSEILPLVQKTVDRKNPREWYYALMDYGVFLKKNHPNPSRKSLHYRKQSAFKGSNRELRAKILDLISRNSETERNLAKTLLGSAEQIRKNLSDLEKEGFIVKKKEKYTIS